MNDAPSINHLFFADDSLLFCQINIEEWLKIQELLGIHLTASRKIMNFQKISKFFSSNTKTVCRTQILNSSGVNECPSQEKYLGLPAIVGRSKLSSFASISEKVWARVNNWKNKFLSQVGK